jgi:hypothetical protein
VGVGGQSRRGKWVWGDRGGRGRWCVNWVCQGVGQGGDKEGEGEKQGT